MYHLGIAFIAIIDEDDSRNFVEKNFPELWEKLVGTVGFIELWYLFRFLKLSIAHNSENYL